MILNISGRTDIVAFYTPWLINRYQEGFVDVRNPFYPSQVSRIFFEHVDAIVFCTKNPIPILDSIDLFDKPILFQITLTPYHNDIEPNVPNKKEIIKAIQILSNKLGKENIYVRYDPILVNDTYTLDYHARAFEKMCSYLQEHISHIIISFVDSYKNVEYHAHDLNLKALSETDYQWIGKTFSMIASKYQMDIRTCFEEHNLIEYGFLNEPCVPVKTIFEKTNKLFPIWKVRDCGCAKMVDIGAYNSCMHYCKYCYANFDESKIHQNINLHDPKSSLLIGHIQPNDIIKIKTK